ncbi:hypothetical protein ABIC22_005284 [Paenibacillus sp. PvP094]
MLNVCQAVISLFEITACYFCLTFLLQNKRYITASAVYDI